MDPSEFRRHGHALVDWVADYLSASPRPPVLARVAPGAVEAALPNAAPEEPESFEAIMADVDRVLVPALTHWNHPGFFAYFATSASPPGVLAELLAAALNQQAMLWRTSPAATELEAVATGWLRRLLGLPAPFEGVIYDTASVSTLHALAAARQVAMPGVRTHGHSGTGRVYCSEQAHSSVDKGVALLGFGLEGVRRIAVDAAFAMQPDRLAAAIAEDRAAGHVPVAVVATIGTTVTTSSDPVAAIADICRREGLWLHVDAAYAGPAAMLPERAVAFDGWDLADSVVTNPHKWLLTPFDLSVLLCRRMDVVREAFSVVPDYLRTTDGDVKNLMDTGIQLGRRFRALKLWMVLRSYGAAGIREMLREHMRLARLFADWVDADAGFERLAPVPFSVVCFRACPASLQGDAEGLDRLNERLLDRVNATGEVFLSSSRLRGVVTLRLAVGNFQTRLEHVARAWELLTRETTRLLASA